VDEFLTKLYDEGLIEIRGGPSEPLRSPAPASALERARRVGRSARTPLHCGFDVRLIRDLRNNE
jgi:hypothetical protein